MELNWVRIAATESQRHQQRKLFHRFAKRWADWWEDHWESYVDDTQYAKVNLSPLDEPAKSLVRRRQPPAGQGVRLDESHSNCIVQSVNESTRQCFVDLDTGRQADWPKSLSPPEEIGLDSPKLLAWARAEGLDIVGVNYTPKGDNGPLFCLKPIDMNVWRITPEEHRGLEQAMAGEKPYPLSRLVKLMVPIRKVERPYDYKYGGAAFLFVTREGTAGLIHMTGQVTDTDVVVGAPASADSQFSPVGFYRGAKISFATMTEPSVDRP